MDTMRTSRLKMLQDAMQRFAGLPPEVFFKEDLLRLGLSLGSSGSPEGSYQKKSYFIFSFDRTPIREMHQQENLRAPEEIALMGGPFGLRRTIVSVRLNTASPYRLEQTGDGFALLLEDETLCRVEFPPEPPHYRKSLSNGKLASEIAPTIEWGYLIYLTVFRRCQYVGSDQECQFCDINQNYEQQRAAGLPYTSVKSVEEILEALEILASTDTRSRAYTLTGGSVTSTLRGKSEADFYAQYAAAIEKRFPGKWIGKAVVQAPAGRGTPEVSRCRHPHLPSQLRSVGRAPLCAAVSRKAALHRAAEMDGPHPGRAGGVRDFLCDP